MYATLSQFFFGPGYVTKAVGFFKHPEKGSWPIIQQHIKFYLLNSFYICSNQSDRVYLSAALGYPLSRTNCSPLPKHIYINRMLVGENNVSAQNCILFAPTHRWDKLIPPLTIYLNDNSFVDHVMSLGFGIYHSKHPETVDAQLDERVQIFKNNWTGISCVVTDYSSIGEDYLFSGGKTVIAHMEDRKEFEKNQGVGPLFMSNKTDKTITYTLEELKEVLDKLDQETCTPVPNLLNINNYFQHVIKKMNSDNIYNKFSNSIVTNGLISTLDKSLKWFKIYLRKNRFYISIKLEKMFSLQYIKKIIGLVQKV